MNRNDVTLVTLSGICVHVRELAESSLVECPPSGCIGGVIFRLGGPSVSSAVIFFDSIAFKEGMGESEGEYMEDGPLEE